LPPRNDLHYVAFVDVSGGRQDRYAIAIALTAKVVRTIWPMPSAARFQKAVTADLRQ
jgi:hypothetical protein